MYTRGNQRNSAAANAGCGLGLPCWSRGQAYQLRDSQCPPKHEPAEPLVAKIDQVEALEHEGYQTYSDATSKSWDVTWREAVSK